MAHNENNPDNMGMTQMLEAGKISHSVNDMLEKHKITVYDIEICCKNVFRDSDVIDTWVDLTADFREDNIEPWDEDWIIPAFRKDLIKQANKMAQFPPNLSGVGLAMFPSSNRTQPRFTLIKNILSLGVKPGGATVITGVSGAGKTTIMSQDILDDSINMPNWLTTTNMYIKNFKHPEFQYASRLSKALDSSLVWDLSGYDLEEKRYNDWLLDEQQIGRDRQKGSTRENISLKHLTLVIRKIGGHQRLVYQQNKLPSEIFEFATHWIHKPSFTNRGLVHYRNDVYNFNYKISGVKSMEQRMADNETYYEFETEHFAPMSIDIFVDKAYTYLAGFDNMDSEGLKREFLKYVRKVGGETTGLIPRDSVKEMAYYCHVKSMTTSDKVLKKLGNNITKLALFFGLHEPSGLEAGRKELARYFDKRKADGGKPDIREPEDILFIKPEKD